GLYALPEQGADALSSERRSGAVCLILPQGEHKQRTPRRDGYVLPAIHTVAHRPGVHLSAQGRVPQELPAAGIQRHEVAVLAATKNQVAVSGQHTAPGDVAEIEFPHLLERLRIVGADDATGFVVTVEVWLQGDVAHAGLPGVGGNGLRELAFDGDDARVF